MGVTGVQTWLSRSRADGTRLLVDAALGAGVRALVYPSFAPIYADGGADWLSWGSPIAPTDILESTVVAEREVERFSARSEEHTSELQSRQYLVCRLLL